MQFQWRWKTVLCVSVFGAALGGMASVGLSADPVPKYFSPEEAIAQLKDAKGPDAAKAREAILKGTASLSVTDKNRYAEKFGSLLPDLLDPVKNTNADGAINAIMTQVELDVLYSDAALIKALGNSNPAIRYWAAKGLGNIMDRIRSIGSGAVAKAVTPLKNQLDVETSGVVKQQIVRAIAGAQSTSDTAAAVGVVAKGMEGAAPDIGLISAAAVGVEAITTAIKGGAALTPAEKAEALTATAMAMSYAAQQNNALADKNVLPEGQNAAAIVLVRRGIELINAVAGKKIVDPAQISDKDTPTDLIVDVFAIVGSPTVPGTLQATFPAIAAPGAIKSGA